MGKLCSFIDSTNIECLLQTRLEVLGYSSDQNKIPCPHGTVGSNGRGERPWTSLKSTTHLGGRMLPTWGGEVPSEQPALCGHLLEVEATRVPPLLFTTDLF